MRIDSWPDWHLRARATTQPTRSECEWSGIAIAPGSDEGLILVEGFPLQAGRVLPIRSNKYSIERARPRGVDLDDPRLDCINSLSVILFADPAELGAVIARPNGKYSARNITHGGLGTDVAFTIPFIGRRQALFVLQSDDLGAGTFSYDIIGVRYQDSTRSIVEYPATAVTGATLSSDATLAFYIGGTNDAESWDALKLRLFAFGNAHWNVDAETIGEIGAY